MHLTSPRKRFVHQRILSFALLAFVVLASSGCTLRLIGDYDDVIDKGVTDFQQKAESFLTDLETNIGTDHDAYKPDFYNDAQARLNALRTRARASFRKDILMQQLDLLGKSIEDFRQLHKSFGHNGADINQGALEATRSAIETQVEAILKLELALKRGKTGSALRPLTTFGLPPVPTPRPMEKAD